jgi:hypothetical protein
MDFNELLGRLQIGERGCKAGGARGAKQHAAIFFCAPLFRFFRGFVFDEPITFYDVQA